MRAIEAENPDLKDILPKDLQPAGKPSLVELLKIMASIPMDIEGDAFGKIYEYFLGKFAMAEGQKGGEFFTPRPSSNSSSRYWSRFMAESATLPVDRAVCSSRAPGSLKSTRRTHRLKSAFTVRSGWLKPSRSDKMNLAVHGLAGDIRQGNTYYEDLHNSPGKFDFRPGQSSVQC